MSRTYAVLVTLTALAILALVTGCAWQFGEHVAQVLWP
jgi:Flp pilus assembly pilin Flp